MIKIIVLCEMLMQSTNEKGWEFLLLFFTCIYNFCKMWCYSFECHEFFVIKSLSLYFGPRLKDNPLSMRKSVFVLKFIIAIRESG